MTRASAADETGFPYVMPWDDAEATVVSVASLNAAPAGGNGFLSGHNGHFYDEKGHRVRFIGVNMVAGANFPDRTTAEKVAARLHKYGINIVRLHHMDADWAKPSIFDRSFPDKQHLSAESLARLDYFVYQLKRRGIYVNLNLHVSREFTLADQVPEADQLHDFDKAVDFYDARMIALQRDYARDLLTHLNPFTKTRYIEEPAVACIEINNENTLLGEAWGGKLEALPPYYKTELARLWNDWLTKKYGNTLELKRAWSAEDKPYGPNILQNSLFEQGAIRWTVEMNTAPATAKLTLPEEAEPPAGVKGRVARLTVSKLGAQNWHLQFHQAGLDLVEGEPYTVTFYARAKAARPMPVYAGVDRGDYHHIGLDATASLTKEWQPYTFSFTANHTLTAHNRLTFVLGDALGDVDLADIELKPGAEYAFPANASLEARNLVAGRPVNTPSGRDWIAFLADTERVYMQGMRTYVKDTLKARAMVTGSQSSWGGLGGMLRESLFDYADNHAYWEHPNFPHKAWDMTDWNIPNTAMTRSTSGGTLASLARYRVAGLPYTISEYQHPAPNEYRAEALPMLAAFAALQDWDGFYLFDYHDGNEGWEGGRISSFFHSDSDPALMAFLPAAAMMFERFDVPFAHQEARLHYGRNEAASLMAKNGPDIGAEWQDAGVSGLDCLQERLSVAVDEKATPKPEPGGAQPKPREGNMVPARAGGAISWTGQGTDRALFRADSPSSKAIVGYLGGTSAGVNGFEVEMAAGGHNFGVLTLSAVDGKPVEQSRVLLLTALCNVTNQGMEWNANHTSVGDHWGTGPTQAITPTASVHISTGASKATVFALDAKGAHSAEIGCTIRNSTLTFEIKPEYHAVWYEVRLTPGR